MADIQLDSVTNASSTGVFDQLMSAVNTHIEAQYLNNRITGSDYANVYLGSMQAVLQQSMQYVMQEQLIEAQVDGVLADNLLKNKQLETAQQELAIRQYELNNTLPAQLAQIQTQTAEIADSTIRANTELSDQLVNTANDRDIKTRGIIEQELTGAKQRILLDTQEEAEQYKVDNILPAELASINKEIDVTERQMSEQEATGAKQRIILDDDHALKAYENTVLQVDQHTTNIKQQVLLDTQEETEQYKVDFILPAELTSINKDVDVKERNMAEQEATGIKQRLIMDKDVAIKTYENTILQPDQHNTNLAQQTLLATEEEAKQYEVDFILPEQVTKLQEEIDLLQTQELSVSSDNYSKTAQVEAELRKQWGYNVTNTAGNLTLGTSTDTGRVDIETKIIEQKVVGKRQSTVIAE